MKKITKKIISFFHTKKHWWENPKKRVALIIGVFILGIFTYRIAQGVFSGNPEETITKSNKVSVQTIAALSTKDETIKASGIVESVDQVELRSEVSARVATVAVSLGQKVKPGQTLVTFYNKDAAASYQDAAARVQAALATRDQFQATLDAQKTRLSELLRGARPEEVDIANQSVINAENALGEAKKSQEKAIYKAEEDLKKTISSSISAMKRSVQSAIDTLYSASNIQYNYFVGNDQDDISIKNTKEQAVYVLLGQKDAGSWNARYIVELKGGVKGELALANQDTPVEDVIIIADKTIMAIESVMALYDVIPLVPEMTTADITLILNEKQRLHNELSAVIAAKNAIDSQLVINENALQAASAAVVNAQSGVDSAKKQQLLVQAGASTEQIRAQEAAVKQAEASLRAQNAQLLSATAAVTAASAQIDKRVIKSPISGSIATLPVRKDELVSPGSVVASVVNSDILQVKTYIDSSQLAAVSKDATAIIDGRVSGTIHFIAPAIDLSTGKVEVIILVDNNDTRPLVVGQYVDVAIDGTQQEEQTIQALLPLDALFITETEASVFTVNEENIVEQVPVFLGKVRGTRVEILAGVSDDMMIITSVRDVKVGQHVEIK